MWKRINRVVVFLYQLGVLPLVVGNFILLLFTRGRRTGKIRTNPLEYRTRNGVIHVFAARGIEADWFKNILANPESNDIQVRFRRFSPHITVIKNIDEKEEILRWYIHEYTRAAKFLFGWDPKTDDPHETDISSLLEIIQIIQLREQENTNVT
jgi:deazaflavin-dependent oxidoreductase (nitroreductase family)